jgi:multidrug efflux pump subunit AcrA (membrane-fusion protein)
MMLPRSLTRLLRWLGLMFLASGIVCGSLVFLVPERAKAQSDRGTASKAALVVRVQTVAPTPIAEYSEAVGMVRSQVTTVLSSKVVAYIQEVLVREGERVRTGQPLIRLDDRDMAAQIRRAEAALEEAHNAVDEVEKGVAAANSQFADATLKRDQLMLEQQAVSRQEFDAVLAKQKAADAELAQAEATIKALHAKKRQVLAKIVQAKAEVANAQISLGYATIRAPIDAVVLERKADSRNRRHLSQGRSMSGLPLLSTFWGNLSEICPC